MQPVHTQCIDLYGVPTGIRTPVTAVKGRCPRPLDDGDASCGLLRSRFGGGGKRDRTADLLHAMQALSQLSYTPTANREIIAERPSAGKPRRVPCAGRGRGPVRTAGPIFPLSSAAFLSNSIDAAATRPSARSTPISARPRRLSSPARPAASVAPLARACARAARPSCCTDASCASSKRCTTRSSPQAIPSR